MQGFPIAVHRAGLVSGVVFPNWGPPSSRVICCYKLELQCAEWSPEDARLYSRIQDMCKYDPPQICTTYT